RLCSTERRSDPASGCRVACRLGLKADSWGMRNAAKRDSSVSFVWLRAITARLALVAVGALLGDWAAYVLWGLLSADPYATSGMDEIRTNVRAIAPVIPPRKSVDEYVIGVFGGSVAGQLADDWARDWRTLPACLELSRSKGRPLHILDL